MEERWLPSTLIVSSAADHGAGSLRSALVAAGSGDQISFAPALVGQTIQLSSGPLDIVGNVQIAGPGFANLTVAGDRASSVFDVPAGATAQISGLTITKGGGSTGGGVRNVGTLVLVDCQIVGNSVSGPNGQGGGTFNSGTLTLRHTTVTGNSARGANSAGGGIANTGTLTIDGCEIDGNTVFGNGGGLAGLGGSVRVTASSFVGDFTLGGAGGAVSISSGPAAFVNCTFSGNGTTANGPGAGLDVGTGTSLTNCTVAGNAATGPAGGILATGPVRLVNTILAQNSAASAPDLSGPVTADSHNNLIGNPSGAIGLTATNRLGTASVPLDPKLSPSADNGSGRLTRALLPGSPAIDAADPAAAPAIDERGQPRHGLPDIGAFELPPPAPSVVLHGPDGASVFSQVVTFTATVAAPGGNPTGTIQFFDGTALLGSATVQDGTASFITSSLSAGRHQLTATYGGDATFGQASSAALAQVVVPAADTVRLSSPNVDSPLGQPVVLTAQVTASAPATAMPTGPVRIVENGTILAEMPLTDGQATFSLTGLSQGPHTLQLEYVGDGHFVAASTAPLRQNVGTPRQRFITQVYRDLLGHAPEAGAIDYWMEFLRQGHSRQDLVEQIAASPEYRARQVRQWFTRYLGRDAEVGAVTYFSNVMTTGATSVQVQASILGSNEFYARTGGTDAGFIAALYRAVLGRDVEAGGLAYWQSRLAAGASRAQVALAVLSSSEANARTVAADYRDFLHRQAEAVGLAFWTAVLGAGQRPEQILGAIVGSAEYFGRV